MATEIERKFLILPEKWEALTKPQPLYCLQSYIATENKKVVRARVIGDKGFLTIKGKTEGISRLEFEYEIPKSEAQEMIDQLGGPAIEKNRFFIPQDEYTWEIDVFMGDNEGLLVAEIELPSVDAKFNKPDWLGKEVSDAPKYYNVNLQQSPFKTWA